MFSIIELIYEKRIDLSNNSRILDLNGLDSKMDETQKLEVGLFRLFSEMMSRMISGRVFETSNSFFIYM
jgi:hypothetical protein